MRRRSTLVIVFAKAPQPGRVKTRLAACLGAEGAARLHAALVERTLAVASRAKCGPVELHGAPRGNRRLRAMARRQGIGLRWQAGGDIGARMHSALRRALRLHSRVILVGSDCPVLAPSDLRRATRLLATCDAVIAPAEDGGYPMIGVSRSGGGLARLFEGIEWSTSSVLASTRKRLASMDWRWRELRTLWDVDRPADVGRLRRMRFRERRP